MEISVVVTTFKNPHKLEKALQSVKQQSFKDIELIVVDGANSEGCRRVAETYNATFIGLEKDLPPPNGVQRSRNVGASASNCDFIAFLDDDDEWHPKKLEYQLKEFHPHEKVGLVSCYTEEVTKKGRRFIGHKKREPSFQDLLKNFEVSSTSSFMVSKEALTEAGGWNENIRGMHEYDVALRIARLGYKVVNVPKPLLIKYQDLDYQLGTIYWKIAEMFEFFRLYRGDLMRLLGWKGIIYSLIKMWLSISIYTTTPIIGDRIWETLSVVKGVQKKYENKREHKTYS